MDQTPSILIVDPDEQFSAALAAAAQAAGLAVTCCRNWWEAKTLVESRADIALLIVELVQGPRMPNGLSLALMSRARRRDLPVLFTSLQPELLAEVPPGTGVVLAKSVGVERLIQCAAEILAGEGLPPRRPVPHLRSVPRLVLRPEAHYRLDAEVRFLSVSERALVLWRKSRVEVLGRPLIEVFPEVEGQPKFQAHLETLASKRPFVGVVASVILDEPIDIRIAADRQGLRVDFRLAA